MIKIDAKTKQLGVIGCPVEHSFSPQMHNYISEMVGKNYIYNAFLVESGDLKEAVAGIRALGMAGVNVTVPHKQAVIPYLDELSDEARLFNSVNTIVNRNGRLIGYSTDADGFYMSLSKEGFDFNKKNILILGAGGVVQPLAMMMAQKGAESITIINRTRQKAEKIAELIRDTIGYEVSCEIRLSHYDLVVNMTSVGLYPEIDKIPEFDMSLIDGTSYVADLIYNPRETLFLKSARERGAKTVNGLGMLIYQGMLSYELFTGERLDDNIYDEILNKVFKG